MSNHRLHAHWTDLRHALNRAVFFVLCLVFAQLLVVAAVLAVLTQETSVAAAELDPAPILITSDCETAQVTAGDGFYPGPTRIERDEHGCVVTARVFHVFDERVYLSLQMR